MVHDGSPGAEGSLAGFERALSARLADLLCDCATATPAVSLFRLWPRLAAEQLDLAAALRHLADNKHLRLAREWAGSLDVEYQACNPTLRRSMWAGPWVWTSWPAAYAEHT